MGRKRYAFSLLLAFVHLFKHTTAGITDGAVEKIRLPTVLHLQNKSLSLVGLTINIIDNASLVLGGGQFFLVLKNDILYLKFADQQVIKKAYQQVFAELLSEESFESPVSKRIDVFSHSDEFFGCFFTISITKIVDFL